MQGGAEVPLLPELDSFRSFKQQSSRAGEEAGGGRRLKRVKHSHSHHTAGQSGRLDDAGLLPECLTGCWQYRSSVSSNNQAMPGVSRRMVHEIMVALERG